MSGMEVSVSLPTSENAAGSELTLEEIAALAQADRFLDDAKLAELEARAGGRDAFIALIFDAALESLKHTNRALEGELAESREFNRDFLAGMAELGASQRDTRALIEGLVNG